MPKNPNEGDAVFNILLNSGPNICPRSQNAGITRIDGLNRKVDFHPLRYTFCTMLTPKATLQRMAQELMRHSDPHLSTQIYTDVSPLPTFDAVATLPWLDQKDTKIESLNLSGNLT